MYEVFEGLRPEEAARWRIAVGEHVWVLWNHFEGFYRRRAVIVDLARRESLYLRHRREENRALLHVGGLRRWK